MIAWLTGSGSSDAHRGDPYDLYSLPTELGSGGHTTRGGGYVKITSEATITVDGTISAK